MVCYLPLPLQGGPVMEDQFPFGWWQQNYYHYQNKPAYTHMKLFSQEQSNKNELLLRHDPDKDGSSCNLEIIVISI